MTRQIFILAHEKARANAIKAVRDAPPGYGVVVHERVRSLDQNARFHAQLSALARSGLKWAGKHRSLEEWKALLVSGHSLATGEGAEMVIGIEGESVAIRESTSRMSKARSSSLIEYTSAFMADNGIHEVVHDYD